MEKLCSYCVHLLLAFSGRSDRISLYRTASKFCPVSPGSQGIQDRISAAVSLFPRDFSYEKNTGNRSAVVDVVINLDHLPQRSEDVHVLSQQMSLGGCAIILLILSAISKFPIFLSSVGTGAYGDFVRNSLAQRGIHSPIPLPCGTTDAATASWKQTASGPLCVLSRAEYLFERSWFDAIDASQGGAAFTSADWRLRRPPAPILSAIWKSIRNLRCFSLRGPASPGSSRP